MKAALLCFGLHITVSYKVVLTSRKPKVGYIYDAARMDNLSFLWPSVANNYNEKNPPLI